MNDEFGQVRVLSTDINHYEKQKRCKALIVRLNGQVVQNNCSKCRYLHTFLTMLTIILNLIFQPFSIALYYFKQVIGKCLILH